MCYCDQLIGCTTYTHGSIPDECTETVFVMKTRPSCGTGPALPVEQLKKHLYFSHTTSVWTALFVKRISVSFIRFFKILKQKSLDSFATEFFINNRKMLMLKADWNRIREPLTSPSSMTLLSITQDSTPQKHYYFSKRPNIYNRTYQSASSARVVTFV